MKDYYHKILTTLKSLKDIHPEVTMGKHLATITDDQEIWGMSDKELSRLVDEYSKSIALDKIHPDKEIDKIIDEGLHLDRFKLYEDADLPPLDD